MLNNISNLSTVFLFFFVFFVNKMKLKLQLIYFSWQDINTVERILASILHLTQIEFNIETTQGITIKSTSSLDTGA